MSEVVSLVAELRESVGTGSARELRRNGMVPAIIYGAGREPLSIAVSEKEMTKYYRKPQFISQIFEFEIGEKKHKVLPKDIQLHPTSELVRHVDFVFLEKDKQKMQVPVVYNNKETCLGVKRGGYFNTVKRTLEIICPVANLPRKLEIDVSEMPSGSTVKAGDIALPEGAELVLDPKFVIASIIGKRGKQTEEEGAEGASEESSDSVAASGQ